MYVAQNRTKDKTFHLPRELSRCFTNAVLREAPTSRSTSGDAPKHSLNSLVGVTRPTPEDFKQVREELVEETDE